MMLLLPGCVCCLHVHHCYSFDLAHSNVAELSLSLDDDLQPSARLSPPAGIILTKQHLIQAL